MGRFAAYKDYGEANWRIGYDSLKLGKRRVAYNEKAGRAEIEKQLVEDLKEFSKEISQYVYVPLNRHKKGAVLSFARSVGILGFKNSKLLELINRHASKKEIISEWSPYINRYWLCGGDRMRDRRRAELNAFLSADKEIPTFTKHNCHTSICLLNLAETYNGAPNQIKAVEYLEKKIKEWDPTGHALRRFYRLWSQPPTGLGNQVRFGQDVEEDQ
jgi:GH24 family phage-related lysozyme (muramidase)